MRGERNRKLYLITAEMEMNKEKSGWIWLSVIWELLVYHTRSFPSQIVCVCDEGGRVKWRFETWVVDPNYLEERPTGVLQKWTPVWENAGRLLLTPWTPRAVKEKFEIFFFKLISFTYIPSYLLIILIYELSLMNHYTIYNNI